MRIAAQLEYDGGAYCGWQKQQAGVVTVQTCVEAALSKVAAAPTQVFCAGRTDTGVHALGQVIHFEAQTDRRMREWVLGGNYYLPPDIRLVWAKRVDDAFHARFSATARSYRYRIYNRPIASAVHRQHTTWVKRALDAPRMHAAAQALLGKHDFSSYRAAGCQSHTPCREVTRLVVTRGKNLVTIELSANAFLQHMVRNIAGVLIKIGVGDQPVRWAKVVLDQRDRTQAAMTAPATGLTFMQVDYPAHFQLPTVE